MFRFVVSEIDFGSWPGIRNRDMLTDAIDVFGADLAGARAALGRLAGATQDQLADTWPSAHRPTRLCRAARRARGEI